MKYNVGDKVRIRKDLKLGTAYTMDDGSNTLSVINEMDNYFGLVTTIASYDVHDAYKLAIDNQTFLWTDKMLEPYVDIDDWQNMILDQSLETNGIAMELVLCMEECAELIVELSQMHPDFVPMGLQGEKIRMMCKRIRKLGINVSDDEINPQIIACHDGVIEEAADVSIILKYIKKLFGDFHLMEKSKFYRLASRLHMSKDDLI